MGCMDGVTGGRGGVLGMRQGALLAALGRVEIMISYLTYEP